jgi:hypothetical protein
VERVEGVEELLQRLLAALQELDVVDHEHVDASVTPLERVADTRADRVDEFVEKRLTRHVSHLVAAVVLVDVVADGLEQVGLAEPGVAVDEQRVVGEPGSFGDCEGRGVRETVGSTDDEAIEGVLRVQRVAGAVSNGAFDWLRCSRMGAVAMCCCAAVSVIRLVAREAEHVERVRSGGRWFGCVSADLDAQVGPRGTDVSERRSNHLEIARLDALLHPRARNRQDESCVVVRQRGDVRE